MTMLHSEPKSCWLAQGKPFLFSGENGLEWIRVDAECAGEGGSVDWAAWGESSAVSVFEILSLVKSVCCKPSPGICGNRLLQLEKSANETIPLSEGFGTKSRMTAFTRSIFRAETGFELSRITGNGERVRPVLESPAVDSARCYDSATKKIGL